MHVPPHTRSSPRAASSAPTTAPARTTASIAVENYLKAILLLQAKSSINQAAAGDIAQTLDLTPGTVSTMVKRLAADKLVRYERYAGIQLTPKGRAIALSVVRRHRLIETFLVRVLGLDWSEVHDEAERLEHAISEKLLDKIDAHLGRPATDPHGDPIPDAAGRLAALPATTLAHAQPGTSVRILRVDEHDTDLLNYLRHLGLGPGAKVTVLAKNHGPGTLSITTDAGTTATLAHAAAAKIIAE